MPSAKFTQTYEKVSKMGEKLKAAGKQGPSNDEQLNVRISHFYDSKCICASIPVTRARIWEYKTLT